MKKLSFLALGLMVLLSSCFKEPTPEPTGEAKVRVANASATSVPQDVYYNGQKMNIAPLAYGQVSGYQTISSGASFFGFTDNGSTISNYESGATIKIGEHFTVIYYNTTTNTKNVGFLLDDMTAPPAGKARVRFVHLNSLFANSFAIRIQGGAALVLVVPFANSSAYFDVDAGTKFEVSAVGLTPSEQLFDPVIQAGKIYTIWLNGTATTMQAHTIQQN